MSYATPDRAGRLRGVLRSPRPDTVPALAANACTLVGVLDIAAGVVPRYGHGHSRTPTLTEALPGAFGPLAAALSLSAGVLLLLMTHGLRRRKRGAWRASVVLLPAGALAEVTYRPSLIGVLASVALSAAPLAVLLRHRGGFTAWPDPRSRWPALANFVLMGAGSLVLGLVVVSVHPQRLVGDPSLADRIAHVLYGLFGLAGPLDYTGGTSSTVAFSLGALGLLTAGTTVYLAFRPEHPAARLTEDDETRLRALLAKHGGHDSLHHSTLRHSPLCHSALRHSALRHSALRHSALRRDTAVVFSPSGKAAVAYRVVSGVMLADGDPIGEVEAWPGAIERFMDEAGAHFWTPAVTGCSTTGGKVWTRETGLVPREATFATATTATAATAATVRVPPVRTTATSGTSETSGTSQVAPTTPATQVTQITQGAATSQTRSSRSPPWA
ncbi:lysylphosphatidylglycerol synthetase-like protein (DUF2156 family) [Streptomyces aurantiacus]|nr:phosphatidylglycerol lysyltransferase domain-containing protein [Streptomyces aurantiacus]MDQ0776438.1 lysylphosphatidylglycerol synthetase-like protein (DUF2156 family) [Streptomyces aurantiacus]